MKRLFMYVLNLPAITFLMLFYFFECAVQTYVVDAFSEAATTLPFWKWTDWRVVGDHFKDTVRKFKRKQ